MENGIFLSGKFCGAEYSKDNLWRVALMIGLDNYKILMSDGFEPDLYKFGDPIVIKADLWTYNGRTGFNHGRIS